MNNGFLNRSKSGKEKKRGKQHLILEVVILIYM